MMKDDDFKLLKGFALRRTDERTNGRTFAIVESLLRLKNELFDIRINSLNLTSSSLLPPPTREHHSANTEKEN